MILFSRSSDPKKDIIAMADTRPWGFRDYVKSNGFHTVYLITPLRGWPTKIGITEDPVQRFLGLQSAHFDELAFHRFWWLPGVAVASRIEAGFKVGFADYNIRGEWFDMPPERAERQIEAAIGRLGIWSLTQSEMEHLFDDWARKKWGISKHAPSPLPGRSPRKDEPWQRRQETRREPYVPKCPWGHSMR